MGIASSLLAVPFLSLRHSQAQTAGKPPVRFLTLMDSYGVAPDERERSWVESTVGDYALTASSLGAILAPFEAHRDKVIVMSNLSCDSSIKLRDGVTHDKLTSEALTGSRAINGEVGASARQHHGSLDHRIGNYLKDEYGLPNPRVYPHLYLSDYAEPDKTSFCFDQNGNQIRAISGADNIIKSLFGGGVDNSAGELAALDAESHNMALGLVRERLTSIRGELINANASQVIDAYESSVQDLATELELRGASTCEVPSAGNPGGGKTTDSPPVIMEAIHQAFACNLASAITYSVGGEQINQQRYADLYDASKHDANVLPELKLNLHAPSHKETPGAFMAQETVRAWQAGMVANLVDQLSTAVDVDGSMVMDNTVIFLTSAMSNNTHGRENFCLAALAGKNTNLQGGFHYDCAGHTNNELLTTLAQGVMVPDAEFGGFDATGNRLATLNTGPISKMLKEVLS